MKRFLFPFFLITFTTLFFNAAVFSDDVPEDPVFLSQEEAFLLNTRLIQNKIEVTFKIAPRCLLYRDQLKLKTLEGNTIPLKPTDLPDAILKKDEFSNEAHFVYSKQLKFLIPLPQLHGFRLHYQGCVEDGFCYNPVAKEIIFSKTGKAVITDISEEEFNQKSLSESETLSLSLQSNKSFSNFFIFLGLGIVLAFTPCVLPMIPILANILTGGEKRLSTRRAFSLSGFYVLSVATCYAFAGAIAGLAGNHFQTALQKPIFLTFLSFLLLFFALSQFDFIHLQLPQLFSNTLHRLQRNQKAGSNLGAISMGVISAFMVSPCVTPALIGALSYIGQTKNALVGSIALFALALGMGLPLLLAATLGNHLLPKTGLWMNRIKKLTGLLLILLSYSLLDRAFTTPETPLAFSVAAVNSKASFNQALDKARLTKTPLIIDVYADWCISCRQMDREIFNNHQLSSQLNQVHLLRLDMTHQTPELQSLQQELNIIGPPTVLFFNQNGIELKNLRLVGKINSTDFIKNLNQIQ